MAQHPLISVIVPVYKVEAYLDRCVRSIVAQTYQNLEIILVDDGSPDGCGAMCDDWAAKDSRIRVIHRENGSLSAARNTGMAAATGELIAFVDSDDYTRADMYALLYERMQADGSDIAACGVEMVWEDGTPSRMLTKAGSCVLNTEEALRALIEESWLKQPVWYKLYKADLIRDTPFPAGKCHEDVFWSYQAVGKAGKVSVFDQPCYYYTQRPGSIMGEGYSLKRLDGLEAKLLRLDYINAKYPALASPARINLWFSCLYMGQMAMLYLNEADRRKAFEKLTAALRQYPLTAADRKNLPLKQQIWLMLEKASLKTVCRLRNTLKIGI